MKKAAFLIFLFLVYFTAFSQNSKDARNLEILVPTGEIVNDFYVLKKASPKDTVANSVLNIANSTYIGESTLLFSYVQNYLFNLGISDKIEPPRLAITERQGCFGVMGFILDENGSKIEKPTSGYVDLNKGMFSRGCNHLESITQLFPHEMGHVLHMQLCSDQKDFEPISKSPTIHYFNILTCYNTAFSEGFAEHFENVARKMEPSEKVKSGIFEDIEARRESIPRYTRGFERDFKMTLRIGFYRAITPLWYQQMENLNRFDLVENGNIRFINSRLGTAGISNAILYRNTGISQDLSRTRNAAQAASTEGVISAFFSGLVLSPLGEKYLSPEFYTPFINDTLSPTGLRSVISPINNQYMKIFHILKNYVKINSTHRGQLFDFVDGYCHEYPGESVEIMDILARTTGISELPVSLPEIWILNRDVNYKFWMMAQFGLTVPYYAFNLNAADSLDLISFEGISGRDAAEIIEYRDRNGFFQAADDITKVIQLSEKTKTILLQNIYDEKNVPENCGRPDFMSLLYLPLLHLLAILLLWFAIILTIYLFLIKEWQLTIKQRIKKSLIQLIKFFLLGFLGLMSLVLFSKSCLIFIIMGIAILGIKAIILYKKRTGMKVSLIITAVMILAIVYSLV